MRLLDLADLDRRTGAYKTIVGLVGECEADLGGADNLSTGERQLIQRAAVLAAMLADLETR
jgi:hypothetical protein